MEGEYLTAVINAANLALGGMDGETMAVQSATVQRDILEIEDF